MEDTEEEDLPRYEADGPDLQTSIRDLLASRGDVELPVHEYPRPPFAFDYDAHRERVEMHRRIVLSFFAAIQSKNRDVVAAMIEHHLVTPHTTGFHRETPLLAAIGNDDIRMVQCLVDFGADPDGLGAWEGAQRTPLQLAAARGHLALVRLFVEVFHADDAKLAPDGELARRLAAQNGHADVVRYLPVRRKGGWRRWKTHHGKAMRRVKRAYEGIVWYGTLILWRIPRFVVWSVPKHVVVKPIVQGVNKCWAKRHVVAQWCKHQAYETPRRIKRAGIAIGDWAIRVCMEIGKLIKKIPAAAVSLSKTVWGTITTTVPRMMMKTLRVFVSFLKNLVVKWIPNLAKAIWKFLVKLVTVQIPGAAASTSKWIWKTLTLIITKWIPNTTKWIWRHFRNFFFKRVPRATKFVLKWVWNGIQALGQALFNVLQRIVAFFHTVTMAIVTFWQKITFQDVWNGFCNVLHAIFVAFPSKVWSWARKVPDVIYNTLEKLFGIAGEILAWIGYALITVIMYIPYQLFLMVTSLGESAAKGFEEVLIWFNPKR